MTITIQTKQATIDTKNELIKCQLSCFYFIHTYIKIYDAVEKAWIPFKLWAEQETVLDEFINHLLVIVLKARQLGLTWEALAYALWQMLFHPSAAIALFSRRDTEAMYLLGDERLRGMYKQLPPWMRFNAPFIADSAHNWVLPNGSSAKAFPTTAGDSYTFSIAIIDEADLCSDLDGLLTSVKPTIDGGGQMIMISRSDKDKPLSTFKNIYRAAKTKKNDWRHIFLPWHVRPERDRAWYKAQERDILARTGSLDDLYEQYPATDTEAMSPRTLNKRIPPVWLEKCFVEMNPLYIVGEGEEKPKHGVPAIPGLKIYTLPEKGRFYKLGIDPAEGNPTSDDSALSVLDDETGEEAASLSGKFQPATIASYADQIGIFYNQASILPERNNHGHAVILWLNDNSKLEVLKGEDNKQGWLSSQLGKVRLYDEAAETVREENTVIHDFETFIQLSNIDGSTLRAPEGQHDDLADSYALALVARRLKPKWRTVRYLGI